MKGETSLQASVIAILAAASLFAGFGVYFTNLTATNGQTLEPSFSYNQYVNSTNSEVANITNVFKSTDPRQNPASIFDLTTVYIYQFASIIYNIPGIMTNMINDVGEQLKVFGVPGWLFAFAVSGIGIFFAFKIGAIIFRRGGDL